MSNGIIYLIQPSELIGTKRYKIGCSKNTELERVKKGYKKGTRYIVIMECKEPFVLEKKIKTNFYNNFKLIAGCEYFEGNEEIMKEEFLKLINEHNKIYIINSNFLIDENNYESDTDEKDIILYFKNYKEDLFFGGNKQLIKITKNKNDYTNKYELILYYIKEGQLEKILIHKNKNMDKYFKNIIKDKIIKINKIYDLYELPNLDKYKKINNDVILSEKTKMYIKKFEKENTLKDKILYLISDLIINNIYCVSNHIDSNSFYFYDKIFCDICKINNNYYDVIYLYHYIPYMIEQKNKTFYILNYFGQYIGTKILCDVSCCGYIGAYYISKLDNIEITSEYEKIDDKTDDKKILTDLKIIKNYQGNIKFIFRKENLNEINQNFINEIKNNYLDLTKNKECLNLNENTKKILFN
jgi:hypothetical protein